MLNIGRTLIRWIVGGVIGLSFLSSPFVSANNSDDYQSQEVTELILGIIHFSRWPDSLQHLQLCIVGDSAHTEFILNTELEVGGYDIDSKWVDDADLLVDLNSCQVLFFGHYDVRHINNVYEQLYGRAVLTIDELNEHCRVGGMFCLYDNDGKLGFKVNLDAVGRSQVRIHPRVLRLGQRASN